MQLTRRRLVVGIGLVVGLVGAALALREARYLAHLPPPVRSRLPAHFRIPFGLAPEVRAGIEGCYARLSEDRLQAAHNLGNLGPAAAPAAPWLVALLADEEPEVGVDGSNAAATPTPPSIDWSACEDWPLIGHLIRLLRGRREGQSHPDAAPEACGALAEIGPAAVEPLTKCLKDDLPRVRMRAAAALGNIADPRAIEPLAALLNDPDSRPRMAAALALGLFRDARAVRHLTETLLHTAVECDKSGGRGAAAGLVIMGPVGWPSITAALKAENRDVRSAAVVGVAYYFDSRELRASQKGGVDLVAALVAALGDPDEGVAAMAAYALSRVKDPAAIDGLIAAVDHPSARVRGNVGEALANFAGPKVADAVAALLKQPDNRWEAACLLAKMGDKRALEPLIEHLSKVAETGNIGMDIEALAALGDVRAVLPLLGVLNNPRGFEKFRGPEYAVDLAASALAQLRDARAIPGLVAACRKWPDSKAVRAALVSFGAQAVDPLLTTLHEGESVGTPIRVLGEIGDRRAVEPLRAMLKGGDPLARVEAAVALAKLGDSQALEVAFEALRDPGTRLAAVKALGSLRDRRAIGPLRALIGLKGPAQEREGGGETAPATIGGGELRKATLQALIGIGDPEAIVPALDEAFRDFPASWVIRPGITWAEYLDLIPNLRTAAVGPLQKALSHPRALVRAEAASLLLMTDGPEALAALRPTFSIQEMPYVYRLIYRFRGEEVAKRTEPLLEILALHKDREVRGAAAADLSENRDPRVIPALRRVAAGDICTSVRAAAWQALEDLTGEDRPATVPPGELDASKPLGPLLDYDWR